MTDQNRIRQEEDKMWEEHKRRIAEEANRTWDELEAELQRLDQEEYDNEVCPCGHRHDDHYLGDGDCQIRHCGCPGFGIDPSEWEEEPRGTNVTGDPGGTWIYDG